MKYNKFSILLIVAMFLISMGFIIQKNVLFALKNPARIVISITLFGIAMIMIVISTIRMIDNFRY